jgi:hypothetical protein
VTGPKEPGEDDWGFPEVDPASTQLPPPPEEEAPASFDTGSDAWWRAQAQAQRLAAADEPVVPPTPPFPPAPPPPPDLVEPEVLSAPSPLDEAWVPPELPAEPVVEEPVDEPPVVEEPVVEEPVVEEAPAASADWYRGLVEPESDAPAEAAVEAPMPELTPPPVDDEPRTREPYEGQRVGPARAAAGAALALLGVVLAVVALIVFNGGSEPKGTPTVAAPPTPSLTPTASATPSRAPVTEPSRAPSRAPSAAPTTAAPATAPVVPIAVLNNTRRTGFAKVAAARFEAGGWPVPTTGNYRGRISQTTIYYAAGQLASAQRFAKQFHVPRVLPRSALPGIPTSGTTVVLTRDYAF